MKKCVVLLVLVLVIVGCEPPRTDPEAPVLGPWSSDDSGLEPPSPSSDACSITDFGSGVLYFDCTRRSFLSALSRYLTAHPLLEVGGVAGNSTCGRGYDCGYQVIMREKQSCNCNNPPAR
ncbi:MAG: hypothetical protein WCV84_05060 [Patescibacteria group bacterium]